MLAHGLPPVPSLPFPSHHLQRRWTGFYTHWPYLTDTIHKKGFSPQPPTTNSLSAPCPLSFPIYSPRLFISSLSSWQGREAYIIPFWGPQKDSFLNFFLKNIHSKDIIVQQILHSSSQRHRDYVDRYEIRLGLYFLGSYVDSFPWLHSRSFLAVPQ